MVNDMDIKKLMMRLKRLNRTTVAILITSVLSIIIVFNYSGLAVKPIETPQAPKPAHQQTIHEVDLNTVHLTQESYKKLGIAITPVQRDYMRQTITYGGDIAIPNGEKIMVSAPIAGMLIAANKGGLAAGQYVKAGQLLYMIKPLLTADARANMLIALADAESLVNTTKTQVEAIDIALKRANKLLDDLVGSQRNVDEAKAAHEIALRNLEAAKAKKAILKQVVNIGTVDPIAIRAPKSGIISNVFAISDQWLSTGNSIIEISETNTLWVRVPIPVAELDSLDLQADAKITKPTSTLKTEYLTAKPVIAPPSADPLTGTVHVFYKISNQQSTFAPAQRISVSISTLKDQKQGIAIPWSSVVFDVYGGSWVYAKTSITSFERKRVFVEQVNGSTAIVSQGLQQGTPIVTNGALELFAIETGFTH